MISYKIISVPTSQSNNSTSCNFRTFFHKQNIKYTRYQINEATIFIIAKDWKHLKCPSVETDFKKKIIMYPIVYLLDGILYSCKNIERGKYTLIWEDTQVEKKSG